MKKENDSEQISVDVSLDKMKGWITSHPKQMIGVVIVIVIIIVVAASAAALNHKKNLTEGGYSSSEDGAAQAKTEGDVSDNRTGDVVTEYSKVEEEDAIKQLVNTYYTAYASGDVAAVEACATPLSEREKGYIGVFSQYAESYQDIEVYLKGGYEENSYFISVVYNLKFIDVETLDPGMDFFYIRTAEDGNIYIDNIYSNFNISSKEYDIDANVSALITEFEKADDVIALRQDIQAKYEAALAADENLKKMMEETLPAAVLAWAKEFNSAQAAAEAQAQAEAQAAAEAEAAAQAQAEAEAAAQAQAEAEAQAAAEAQEAEEAEATDDETSQDEETEEPEEDSQSTPSYFDEGTVIRLTSATNIRVSMSETADKVGVAFAGDTVTVVMSYAEGWTKVNWNDQIGYVKTEILANQ